MHIRGRHQSSDTLGGGSLALVRPLIDSVLSVSSTKHPFAMITNVRYVASTLGSPGDSLAGNMAAEENVNNPSNPVHAATMVRQMQSSQSRDSLITTARSHLHFRASTGHLPLDCSPGYTCQTSTLPECSMSGSYLEKTGKLDLLPSRHAKRATQLFFLNPTKSQNIPVLLNRPAIPRVMYVVS